MQVEREVEAGMRMRNDSNSSREMRVLQIYIIKPNKNEVSGTYGTWHTLARGKKEKTYRLPWKTVPLLCFMEDLFSCNNKKYFLLHVK